MVANYFAINRILNQLQFLEEEALSVDDIEKTGQPQPTTDSKPLLRIVIAEGEEAFL